MQPTAWCQFLSEQITTPYVIYTEIQSYHCRSLRHSIKSSESMHHLIKEQMQDESSENKQMPNRWVLLYSSNKIRTGHYLHSPSSQTFIEGQLQLNNYHQYNDDQHRLGLNLGDFFLADDIWGHGKQRAIAETANLTYTPWSVKFSIVKYWTDPGSGSTILGHPCYPNDKDPMTATTCYSLNICP